VARISLPTREALERLGIKGLATSGPELIDALQPVILMGSVDELIPPLLAAQALVGGQVAAVALENSAFQVHARTPGGMWLTDIGAAGVGTNSFAYTIKLVSSALVIPHPNIDLVPDILSQTLTTTGTSVPGVQIDPLLNPRFSGNVNPVTNRIPSAIFVAAGRFFYLECLTANLALNFTFHVRDVPISLTQQ